MTEQIQSELEQRQRSAMLREEATRRATRVRCDQFPSPRRGVGGSGQQVHVVARPANARPATGRAGARSTVQKPTCKMSTSKGPKQKVTREMSKHVKAIREMSKRYTRPPLEKIRPRIVVETELGLESHKTI
jgi:hypothetical protein